MKGRGVSDNEIDSGWKGGPGEQPRDLRALGHEWGDTGCPQLCPQAGLPRGLEPHGHGASGACPQSSGDPGVQGGAQRSWGVREVVGVPVVSLSFSCSPWGTLGSLGSLWGALRSWGLQGSPWG